MIRRMRRLAHHPNGPGYTPGITSARCGGQTPPELQGLPAPLPPADPPGPPPPPGPGPASAGLPAAGRAGAVEMGGHLPRATILNIRNLKLPGVSRTALVVGTGVVLAIVGGLIGWNVYQKLTTNTVGAYFPDTLGLYAGDKVQTLGAHGGQ